MRRTVFAPLAALALAAGSMVAVAAPATAAAHPATAHSATGRPITALPTTGRLSQVGSSDEAGYVAAGATGAFSKVSSSWTEPKGHCSSGDQYSAFYVGLDGWTSDSIEQIGSELDCQGKTPEYYAWYEMYPSYPVSFSNTVDPGDELSASVTYDGSNEFTLKISDATQGWTKSVKKSLAGAARSSAEVLVEAPPAASGPLPLADFGSVSFTGAMVNSAGLCDSDPIMVTMPGVTVSPITGCTNFTVTETGT